MTELRIKEILKEKNISVQKLADMLNIGVKTISRQINCNPNLPNVETLQKIADALNVHITELFEKPKKTGNAPDVSGFIKINNDIHEIKNIDDFKDLYTSL